MLNPNQHRELPDIPYKKQKDGEQLVLAPNVLDEMRIKASLASEQEPEQPPDSTDLHELGRVAISPFENQGH